MIWQYLLPQHLLSRLIGWLAHCRFHWVKDSFIRWFIKRYQVDMSLALEADPANYANFNAFFTRALKPAIRPIVIGESTIISPADGIVSQAGSIEAGRIFQAKNFYFTTTELFGGHENLAASFQRGNFATIYLAPKDYHRVHMPLDGQLKAMIYIPGRLFSVSTQSANNIPNLFARNERVVALFDTAAGQMAIILVGAMIVASIETIWAGLITPARDAKIQYWSYHDKAIFLKKGDEMGRFQLGSTVVSLFSSPVQWEKSIEPSSAVCMGQSLGFINPGFLTAG